MYREKVEAKPKLNSELTEYVPKRLQTDLELQESENKKKDSHHQINYNTKYISTISLQFPNNLLNQSIRMPLWNYRH